MYKSLLEQIEKLQKGSRQRKMKFNPKDVSSEIRQPIEKWIWSENQEARKNIPKQEGNVRQRGMHKLHGKTEVKTHPETGERMFLLHRGMSWDEFDKLSDANFSKDYTSSWTPLKDMASQMARQEGGLVLSSWIPESQIQSSLAAYGESDESIRRYQSMNDPEDKSTMTSEEQEIIVNPHKLDVDDRLESDAFKDKAHQQRFQTRQKLKEQEQAGKITPEQKQKELKSTFSRQANLKRFNENIEDLTASEKQASDLVKNIISNFKNKLNKNYYTEEQAVDMLKSFILKKCEENPEILEKSDIKTAFKNGLTFLALVNAAHYVGQDKTDQKPLPEPQAIERVKPSEDFYGRGYREEPVTIDRGLAPEETPMIEDTMAEEPSDEIGREPSSEDMEPTVEDDGESHDQKINEFLQAISLNESSGGKNVNHKTMKSGMHKGDTAIGKYGLMPNTVQEMAGRIRRDFGSKHPLASYKKMDEKQMRESFKKNPEHEEDLAKYMANFVYDKYKGDENKMSWSWLNGHNTKDFPKDFENNDYVKKYNKHIQQVRKPKEPEVALNNEPM